jgi:hypothetical protein
MFNPSFFIHLTFLQSDELSVNYQAVCLLHVLLSFGLNSLNITLKTLAKIMRCSLDDVKTSLNFIQKSHLITWQFVATPDAILDGWIIVNFNREKIDKISSGSWPRNKQDSYRTGSVYLVRNDHNGMVKVGRSLNVEKRLKTLQTSNPFPLTLILTILTNDSPQVESNLHKIFRHKRVYGEWFNLSDQDIDLVLNLKQQIENPVAKSVKTSVVDSELPF